MAATRTGRDYSGADEPRPTARARSARDDVAPGARSAAAAARRRRDGAARRLGAAGRDRRARPRRHLRRCRERDLRRAADARRRSGPGVRRQRRVQPPPSSCTWSCSRGRSPGCARRTSAGLRARAACRARRGSRSMRLVLLDVLIGTPLAFAIGGLEKADQAALGAPLLLIVLVLHALRRLRDRRRRPHAAPGPPRQHARAPATPVRLARRHRRVARAVVHPLGRARSLRSTTARPRWH